MRQKIILILKALKNNKINNNYILILHIYFDYNLFFYYILISQFSYFYIWPNKFELGGVDILTSAKS